MSNKLEEFISNNREEFDSNMPPENIWFKLNAAVEKKRKTRLVHMPLFKWGTSIAALLIIGTFIFLKFYKKDPGEKQLVKSATDINILSPEYAPQVNAFAKLIDMKQEELKVISKEQPELYQKFTTDINQLDSSYNALKEQISVCPNQELLMQAMIQNLQLQINVLNQQLNIIKEIKQSKKDKHEKNYQKI